jgi:murein DD-endopeptidase MepM/ murein hydrolase activator NlpD
MKKIPILFILLLVILPISSRASSGAISISPKIIYQGDPAMVTINSSSAPTEILFDSTNIPIFKYDGLPRGLIAIDFNLKAGEHKVQVKFADGKIITEILAVNARKKLEAPLGIPGKLGGNTPAAAKSLVDNLSKENATLINLKTGNHAFWTKAFRAPLDNLAVTDSYGYNRKTGEYTIPHKGTDFHADSGTKVRAMNRGVVRVAHAYTVYGKTVIIDHGLGVNTLYMHLSKIYVNEGELVLPGQVIGLSGMTGYAEVPHLHLSIKINGISIDPVKFLEFFGVK